MLGPAIQHNGPEANSQTARAPGRTVVGAIATDGEMLECGGGQLAGHPGRQIALFETEELNIGPRVGADERARRGGEVNAQPSPALGAAPRAGGGPAWRELGLRVELRILVIAGRVAVDERGAGRNGRGIREGGGAGLGKAGGGIGVQGTVHGVGETRPFRDAP